MPPFDLPQEMAALLLAWQDRALIFAEPAAEHASFVAVRFESVVRVRGLWEPRGFVGPGAQFELWADTPRDRKTVWP